MKRILTSLLFSIMSIATFAQEDPEPPQLDPKAQEKINNLRIAYLTDKLGLTTEQAEKFWPLYREFAQERRQARAELMQKQGEIDPKNPDPKKQQEVVDLSLKVKQRVLDLEKDYSSRMLKVITAQQLINLRKAEIEFRDILINQLQQRRLNQQRRENFRERNQRLQQKN
jgi:hypothetical protein